MKKIEKFTFQISGREVESYLQFITADQKAKLEDLEDMESEILSDNTEIINTWHDGIPLWHGSNLEYNKDGILKVSSNKGEIDYELEEIVIENESSGFQDFIKSLSKEYNQKYILICTRVSKSGHTYELENVESLDIEKLRISTTSFDENEFVYTSRMINGVTYDNEDLYFKDSEGRGVTFEVDIVHIKDIINSKNK